MLACDPKLAKILRKIGNKQDQTAKIAELLGTVRVLRAWYDPNPSAKYPTKTGTEFYNLQMDGTMSFTAGALTGFGVGKQLNKFTAVDLATGAACMRIEGNGYYIQGSLGLTNDCDFVLTKNPTVESGLAFANTAAINAYTYLPSTPISSTPTRTKNSPYCLTLYSYANPKSPKKEIVSYITNRVDNMVMEDPDMARNHGDVSVYETTATDPWGKFTMGATLLISDKKNTVSGLVQLEEVLALFTYKDQAWNNYPQVDNYHRYSMVMNLPPFKVFMTDEEGTILHIFEQPGGEPINSRNFNSGNLHRGGRTPEAAIYPQFNCAMALPWRNTQAKMTDIAHKLYPGLLNYRDSMSKGQSSMISVEPMYTGGYGGNSLNGLGDFWYADRLPLPYQPKALTDPFLDPHMNASGSSAQYAGWAEGVGYMIGQPGCQNWYTSPGGPRNDRCPMPSILALYLSYPDGFRLEGNIPYRELIDAWNMNSFNHSNHIVFDPNTMETIPPAELFNDVWGMEATYYGSYSRAKAFMMNGDQRDGTGPWNYDMEGNMALAGWAGDPLHDYHNRGWGSMTFCTPLHVIGSKFDTMRSLLLHQYPFNGQIQDYYMVRTMAWHWLNVTIAWKNGTKHPRGLSQSDIETYFGKVLVGLYNTIVKPAFIDNVDTHWARGLRQLGCPVWPVGSTYSETGGRLGFYIGHVLQLMKQTGFWKRMRNLDPRHAAVLDNLIRNLDTFCFGNMVQAQGQCPGGGGYFSFGDGQNLNSIPLTWKDWYDQTAGQPWHDSDYIYKTYWNGSSWVHREYAPNQDVSWNQFEQYARLRKDYFPEIAHPLMDAAIAEFDRYAKDVTDRVNAKTTPFDKTSVDYFYRYPGVSPFKGPAAGDLYT